MPTRPPPTSMAPPRPAPAASNAPTTDQDKVIMFIIIYIKIILPIVRKIMQTIFLTLSTREMRHLYVCAAGASKGIRVERVNG